MLLVQQQLLYLRTVRWGDGSSDWMRFAVDLLDFGWRRFLHRPRPFVAFGSCVTY